MILPNFSTNPFQICLSFHKMIERFEDIAANDIGLKGINAGALLEKLDKHPEFKDGITSVDQIEDNAELLAELLAELFPPALTLNEIKAVSLPYQNFMFNHTGRFKNILKSAGADFEINIRNFDDHQLYVLSCCIVLNAFYNTRLDFSKPLFYDIPTADGITRHYRILYNADFLDILRTENSPQLTEDDINQLRDNYNDLALWKEKFPPGSYLLKGFAIITLVDVTVENALSDLKSNLIGKASAPDLQFSLAGIFRSIFNIPDMQIGFTAFDNGQGKFNNAPLGKKTKSFLLPHQLEKNCNEALCKSSYKSIISEHIYFTVSDVHEFIAQTPESNLGKHFLAQNAQSFILAPIVKNDVLLGVLELVSPRAKELNSVTANKLEIVMPFLVDTIDRKVSEMQNHIRAVIQSHYTTLHPSVYWKFKLEAQNYIQSNNAGLTYTLKEVVFADVYPLYGQVDIKDSSITRNLSVKNDLLNQLNQLIVLVEQLNDDKLSTDAELRLFDMKAFVDALHTDIKADTEQQIQHYLENYIYPILQNTTGYNETIITGINNYFSQVDAVTGEFHLNRRNYEKTLSLINEKLVNILDERQAEIQAYLPHYYERFKTDGVEHNLYIGASITENQKFDVIDHRRLRLWQLAVIAEMEIAQYHLKPLLPYQLEVASLILVFSAPISIRFRMDEKHFDIDGAYNIRYEVIKKRIDKAFIKNTTKRITKREKITIIYTTAEEEQEYMQYIKILQDGKILADKVEHFDVEDLQGVSGLKAIRVGILYDENRHTQSITSYDKFYKQLN